MTRHQVTRVGPDWVTYQFYVTVLTVAAGSRSRSESDPRSRSRRVHGVTASYEKCWCCQCAAMTLGHFFRVCQPVRLGFLRKDTRLETGAGGRAGPPRRPGLPPRPGTVTCRPGPVCRADSVCHRALDASRARRPAGLYSSYSEVLPGRLPVGP